MIVLIVFITLFIEIISPALSLSSDDAVNLTLNSSSDDQNPAFSSDGKNIIFSSKRNGNNLNIWKMDANGTNPIALTNDLDADNVNMPGSSWNGVTNKICFSSDRVNNDEIWTMNPDGTNLIQITNHQAKDWEPTFSPDGKWIVFQSDRDGNWEIYKINVETFQTTRLTNNTADDWEPNWSPKGDKIVFQSKRDGNWEIYTMNTDGTNQYNITNNSYEDTDPSWSSDGKRIVYSSNYGGLDNPQIFIINADGSGYPMRVTNHSDYDGAPSFSPDRSKIAFESDRSGNLDIWTISSPISLSWNSVEDLAYQLQNIDLNALGNTEFDLIVIDYSSDGSEGTRFTTEQISTLKNGPGGPKLVLAYMSIGEAENYRWYWDSNWDKDNDGVPDAGAPSWLGPSNPQWPGNYKVKYWDSNWQAIIYGSPTSYLDKIIETGFDGVYLDVIDAYEYWGPGGESGLNRVTAEQEMVDFVKAIANYARVAKWKTDFGVFPQNGEGLSSHSDYVQAVTGIGREDTWYNGNTPNPSSHTDQVIANLDVFKQAGKLVLVMDYVTQQNLIDDFYSKAISKGYIPYATTRGLDALTINSGHAPTQRKYSLTVTKSGSGGLITSSPSGIYCDNNCKGVSYFYNKSTVVTLTATPDSGSTFSGWSGGCSGTGNCILTMNGNKNVTANFTGTTSIFSDVPTTHWAHNYILAIYNAHITTGCSQNPLKYCPEDNVTREQMAAFLVRAKEGEPAANYCDSGEPFTDVISAMWSCRYIKRLKELGITTGYGDGRYGPLDMVTREQMAAFIIRAVEGEPAVNYCSTGSPFTDVDSNGWACKYIKRLKERGITTGYGDGRYGPSDMVTRAQMAAFLARAFLGMQ